MKIIDISNSSNPVWISDMSLSTPDPATPEPPTPTPYGTLAGSATPSPVPQPEPVKIVFNNNYGYLIQQLRPNLRIFDMSVPAAPVETGWYYPETSSKSFLDIEYGENRLYIAANDGLVILDVTDPVTPAMLGYLEILGTTKLTLDPPYCFMIQSPSNLVVINIAVPSDPVLVEVIDAGIFIKDIFVFDNKIYCTHGQEGSFMSIYSYN